MESKNEEYIFKNSGGIELNDVVYPGQPKQLLYHSYTFRLSPKTDFWRFGIRLSKNKIVQFSPQGRYVNAQYPDIQIVVGDRPQSEWINPNKIELGQYHYLQGYEDQNPFDVCHSYKERSEVIFTIRHNVELNALEVSYEAEGCPRFQKQLQNFGYQYFQYFAWADWIDFELHSSVNIIDHRYIDIPTIPVTENDVRWLNLMYERFKTETKVTTEYQESDLWDNFPREFNPKGINPLLLSGGTNITLYGIYHIDPISPLFETFDKVVYAIRNKLSHGKIPEAVTSKEISEQLANLSQKNIFLVFKLLSSFAEFSRGIGQDNQSILNLRVNDPSVLEQYRTYRGLENFYIDYLKKRNIVRPAVKLNVTFSEPQNKTVGIGRTALKWKRQDQFKPVMGVEEIVGITAEVIESFRAGKGQMIGIFARWGRGKTYMLNLLHELLKQRKIEKWNNGTEYTRIDFDAWKYQETPASWAYLYENLADVFLDKKIYFWRYYPRLIRLNINRKKIWPLLSFIFAFIAAIVPPFLMSSPFTIWSIKWAALASAYWSFAIILISRLKTQLSTKALDLVKKYGVRHSYKPTLGLQAAIQEELVTLIKTWVKKKHLATKQLILYVEDIDRCTEDKIMENIDALRVMLDNDDIAKRLIVVTAIDERILKNAIRMKYDKQLPDDVPIEKRAPTDKDNPIKSKAEKIRELTCEYLDKLFIAAIKLGELNLSQKEEFVSAMLDEYVIDEINPPNLETAVSSDPNPTTNQPSVTRGTSFSPPSSTTIDLAAAAAAAKSFEGLTKKEKQLLTENIATWENATPRAIIIFYYRFLLCKNYLHSTYLKKMSQTIWQKEEVIKGLIYAIHEFARNYDPSKITEKKIKILQQPQIVKIAMASKCIEIDPKDYINMLEAFEIFIAY